MVKPIVRIGPRTILGYHLVWTAYGWWLPNDPRGSMSRVIRNDVIGELGALHHGRKRIQPASKDIRRFYENAQKLLKFPLLTFKPREVDALAGAFAQVMGACGYTCYACAIIPDHVHVLIRKHRDSAERMIANLHKGSRESVLALKERDGNHPVWGGPGWKVFLDSPDDIRRTVRYIDANPVKSRIPAQEWSFVTSYDGWSFGGHRR
jgi:REP element-mobilizing transposase RayT